MLVTQNDRWLIGWDNESRRSLVRNLIAATLVEALVLALFLAVRTIPNAPEVESSLRVELVQEQPVAPPVSTELPPATIIEPRITRPAIDEDVIRAAKEPPIQAPARPQAGATFFPLPPAGCQTGPIDRKHPKSPCPTPPDEKEQRALHDIVAPLDRPEAKAKLAKEADKATSNAAHIELFNTLNEQYHPFQPAEERSLQSRSEAMRGAPGKDISIFAPRTPTPGDKGPGEP